MNMCWILEDEDSHAAVIRTVYVLGVDEESQHSIKGMCVCVEAKGEDKSCVASLK